MTNIKVLVAAHKNASIPADDIYMPIHVGAALHDYELPFSGDNTGENISVKNANYCELTAVYWAWKNLDADYIGLCHYRRFFCNAKRKILSAEEAELLLRNNDILLPKARNYFIETNYSQYAHAHFEKDLTAARDVISELSAEYLPAFDMVMKRTWGHRFNMFIMRKDHFDEYCAWLFPILSELEERIDIHTYDVYNARVYGFIAERLLDVWIEANSESYAEIPYVFTEKQNWLKKIVKFLYRKFSGGKLSAGS